MQCEVLCQGSGIFVVLFGCVTCVTCVVRFLDPIAFVTLLVCVLCNLNRLRKNDSTEYKVLNY